MITRHRLQFRLEYLRAVWSQTLNITLSILLNELLKGDPQELLDVFLRIDYAENIADNDFTSAVLDWT